jgi:hypothetical protein
MDKTAGRRGSEEFSPSCKTNSGNIVRHGNGHCTFYIKSNPGGQVVVLVQKAQLLLLAV